MRSYTDLSFPLIFVSDPVGIDTTTIGGGGGGDPESDPNSEPDANVTFLLSFSPFSACYLEGGDNFSHPLPPYSIMCVHYKYSQHAPSDGIDIDDIEDNNDDAYIRASVVRELLLSTPPAVAVLQFNSPAQEICLLYNADRLAGEY